MGMPEADATEVGRAKGSLERRGRPLARFGVSSMAGRQQTAVNLSFWFRLKVQRLHEVSSVASIMLSVV